MTGVGSGWRILSWRWPRTRRRGDALRRAGVDAVNLFLEEVAVAWEDRRIDTDEQRFLDHLHGLLGLTSDEARRLQDSVTGP